MQPERLKVQFAERVPLLDVRVCWLRLQVMSQAETLGTYTMENIALKRSPRKQARIVRIVTGRYVCQSVMNFDEDYHWQFRSQILDCKLTF